MLANICAISQYFHIHNILKLAFIRICNYFKLTLLIKFNYKLLVHDLRKYRLILYLLFVYIEIIRGKLNYVKYLLLLSHIKF